MKSNKCICEGDWHYTNTVDFGIEGSTIFLGYSACACGSFEDEFKINFCPICGKDLTLSSLKDNIQN